MYLVGGKPKKKNTQKPVVTHQNTSNALFLLLLVVSLSLKSGSGLSQKNTCPKQNQRNG